MTALLQRRAKKAIGMTALIDVVFILLMFFMLTSSFVRRGFVDMNAQAATSGIAAEQKLHWLILHPDGRLSASLSSALLMTDSPELARLIGVGKPLTVLPLSETRLQVVVDTLTILGKLGPSRISLGESIKAEMRQATP